MGEFLRILNESVKPISDEIGRFWILKYPTETSTEVRVETDTVSLLKGNDSILTEDIYSIVRSDVTADKFAKILLEKRDIALKSWDSLNAKEYEGGVNAYIKDFIRYEQIS